MSAEVLRRAAAQMRERAEAATSGPWVVGTMVITDQEGMVEAAYVGCQDETFALAPEVLPEDAVHIASWHPVVAVAVADSLHAAAVDLWAHGPLCECTTGCDACDDNLWEPHVRNALAVARAYLGEA